MSSPKLRIFSGDSTDSVLPQPCKPDRVSVSVGDVVPLLLDAAMGNRVWLEDFADETLEVSQDLYEVLLAYQSIAQPNRAAA